MGTTSLITDVKRRKNSPEGLEDQSQFLIHPGY